MHIPDVVASADQITKCLKFPLLLFIRNVNPSLSLNSWLGRSHAEPQVSLTTTDAGSTGLKATVEIMEIGFWWRIGVNWGGEEVNRGE